MDEDEEYESPCVPLLPKPVVNAVPSPSAETRTDQRTVGVFLADNYTDETLLYDLVRRFAETNTKTRFLMYLCHTQPYKLLARILSKRSDVYQIRHVGPVSFIQKLNKACVDAILSFKLDIALFATTETYYTGPIQDAYVRVEQLPPGSVTVYQLGATIPRVLQAEKPPKHWLTRAGHVAAVTQVFNGLRNVTSEDERKISRQLQRERERSLKQFARKMSNQKSTKGMSAIARANAAKVEANRITAKREAAKIAHKEMIARLEAAAVRQAAENETVNDLEAVATSSMESEP